jgi:hypothetical protein
MMSEYTLFLDESAIPCDEKTKEEYFIIAGVILENGKHDKIITDALNAIKDKIWNNKKDCHDYILHELEANIAKSRDFKRIKNKYNKVFLQPSKYKLLYTEISNLIDISDVTTIGVCINEKSINKLYDSKNLNHRMSISMQMIIENYYHFLSVNNGTGKICYESMPENQNKIIEKRYGQIRNIGTMYYPAKVINKRITHIEFVSKHCNLAGLQIADFIPNSLGRQYCSKNSKSNITYESIYNKLYDGNMGLKEKFGFKILH